jgi:putative aldouronate transport system permease protein
MSNPGTFPVIEKKVRPRRKRRSIEDRIFVTLNTTFLILFALITLYPFWNTIVVSFNQASDTIQGGVYFWPRVWTTQNYKTIFFSGTIYSAFLVSVARTLISVVLNLFLTSMLAYALSRKKFIFRKSFTLIIILTLYVNAGVIPIYFLIRSLGLINSFFVYIIPGLISAWNFLIIRTYIGTVPESLFESARLDGAGEFRIFMQIVFPLLKPVLAAVGLFVAVGNWNSWFDTLLYASSRQELSTLSYELMKYLSASMTQSRSAADIGALGIAKDTASSMVTPMAIRAAITVVASVPILVVYPFLQRHFVKGIALGSVKE